MAKQKHISGLSEEKKRFVKLLETIDYSRRDREVFADFCEFSTWSLQLPFNPDAFEKGAAVIKRYDHDAIVKMDQMFTIMVDSLEVEYHDFLGKIFMSLDMGNDYVGQFFTPWHVCKLMAKISGPDKAVIESAGFITVSDPCVGAGAMLIAYVCELREMGLDHSSCAYFVAEDIDLLACQMSFIQLSLCGVAATVIHGDSLWPDKRWAEWYTPVYYLNDWPMKLMLRDIKDRRKDPKPEPEIVPVKDSREPYKQLKFDF